ERRVELRRVARPDDERRHPRVAQQPRDRECRGLDFSPRRRGLERLERVEGLVAREHFVRSWTQRHPRAGRIALAAPVLAGQPTAGKGAERREPEPLALADRENAVRLLLEQAELVLHPPEAGEAQALARLE